MSASHTPGLLAQDHREGADGMWRTEIFSAEHGGVAAVCHWAPMPPVAGVTGSYRAGNAERLVACWNACEGIETYALELMTGELSINAQLTASSKRTGKLTHKAVEYRRQRDELLDELRHIAGSASNNYVERSVIRKAAEAAIAKVAATPATATGETTP